MLYPFRKKFLIIDIIHHQCIWFPDIKYVFLNIRRVKVITLKKSRGKIPCFYLILKVLKLIFYFLIFLLRPAIPRRPEPRSQIPAGIGTGAH